LIVRSGNESVAAPFQDIAKLGVGPLDGAGAQLAPLLFEVYHPEGDIELVPGRFPELVDLLRRGELDAVLAVDRPGAARLTIALQAGDLELRPLLDWDSHRFPFLRLASIPRNAYARVDREIDTLSSQLVIASARQQRRVLGDASQATALSTSRPAISERVRHTLVEAIGRHEAIDPLLPGSDVTLASPRHKPAPINPTPQDSLLAALVLLAVGGAVLALFGRGDITR
jgi:hypothetical protein